MLKPYMGFGLRLVKWRILFWCKLNISDVKSNGESTNSSVHAEVYALMNYVYRSTFPL